jgi:hypothetical protein
MSRFKMSLASAAEGAGLLPVPVLTVVELAAERLVPD